MTDLTDLDELQTLVPEWISLPDVGRPARHRRVRARQLVAERQILAVRHERVLRVPAAFVVDGRVLKGLPGLLTVLQDCGFDDAEALRWLFTDDPSLPGSPVQALTENRGTEVKRRAQALAL
jgi:hypothetical protein